MPKKSEEENKSEKELEEEIEEIEEDLDENKFVEFLQTSNELNPPVLDKVQNAQEITTLEQDIISVPISKKEKTQDNYESTLNKSDYSEQDYQTNVSSQILEPTKISKELQSPEFLDPMAGRMISPQDNLNQKMIETTFIKRNTKLPFEKDEIEYKDIKV